MGSHQCVVVHPEDAEEALLASTLQLLDSGRKVLVVHSGAVQGARVELALLQALDGPSPLLVLMHRSGSEDEFARSLTMLDSVEGPLDVLLFQSGSPLDSLDAELLTLLTAGSQDWTLTCLFDSGQALGPALGTVLAHEGVCVLGQSSSRNDGAGSDRRASVALSSDEARVLAVDLLLQHAASAPQVRRLEGDKCLSGLDPALLSAVAELHLARLAPLARQRSLEAERVDARRTVVALEEGLDTAARYRSALQLCDGELVPLLRAGAGLAGYRLLLEDADFQVFRWSDEPGPPPPALGAVLTPARVGRLARSLKPGSPESVRLGTPAEGARLVMRLGHRRLLGYLSVLGCPQICPPNLHMLLQQLESPLVTALRYEQGLLRLSHGSRAQVLHALFTGSLTPAEEVQAAAFTGWPGHERRRVAFIVPRQRPPASEASAGAIALNALRVSAENALFLVSVVGGGVAVLCPDSDAAIQGLTEWLPTAGSYILGVSEPIQAAADVALAMRQAQWTAHLARTTGRDLLGFGQLGFDRLLFPSVNVGDIDLTSPLRRLRGQTCTLGFDPAETLEAFLNAGGNVRDGARMLHVHTNTLRYRLTRIEEACELNLSDPHCRFDLQLAFRQEASWRILRGEA